MNTSSHKHLNEGDCPALTLLYDGGCPLCLREVELLGRKDRQRHGERLKLAFWTSISPNTTQIATPASAIEKLWGRIHAIDASGAVLRDVDVFRRAYELIGLGWLYAPTQWPLLRPLTNLAYGIWADIRLRITGRPSLESLCQGRKDICRRD